MKVKVYKNMNKRRRMKEKPFLMKIRFQMLNSCSFFMISIE
jgi:hypothetical protein